MKIKSRTYEYLLKLEILEPHGPRYVCVQSCKNGQTAYCLKTTRKQSPRRIRIQQKRAMLGLNMHGRYDDIVLNQIFTTRKKAYDYGWRWYLAYKYERATLSV